jgi:hypothetical protein
MQRTQSRKVVRLELECLEDRCLPSRAFSPMAVSPPSNPPPAGPANAACSPPNHSAQPLDGGGHPGQWRPGPAPAAGLIADGGPGNPPPGPPGFGGFAPFLAFGPVPIAASDRPPPIGAGDGSLPVAVAQTEVPAPESAETVSRVALLHVLTILLTPESPVLVPSPGSSAWLVSAVFPRVGGLNRETPPIEEPLVHFDPFLPVPTTVNPAPADVTSTAPDARLFGPAGRFDLLVPLLPLGRQELEQAIQELMRRLDTALPVGKAPQSVTDWVPWIIALAGGAAAYEVGRRTLRQRSPEDDFSSGPIGLS